MTAGIGPVEKYVAEMKGIPSRDDLVKLLQENIVQVTFTKLDGEERIMPCTLKAEYFPNPKQNAEQKNEKTVAVWALESNGFRSFRYDRVKSIKIIEGV